MNWFPFEMNWFPLKFLLKRTWSLLKWIVQKMLLFEGFGFDIFLVKRRQTEQRDKAAGVPGSLLFWILYYFGLEAFKGGTLCERVQQAFLAGVVVQKMLLFEGFGFEIFLVRRRQLTEQRHKAPDSAWRFMIMDPLLFWVGGLQGGYPLWEGPTGISCRSGSTENGAFWRLWIWDFLAKRRQIEQRDKSTR